MRDFAASSYASHEEHYGEYTDGGSRSDLKEAWFRKDTIDYYRHFRMYSSLEPLLEAFHDEEWLTVGDGRCGSDANHLHEKGIRVVATDISDALLKEASARGHIGKYQSENMESLSFDDDSFDFVLCKEAFHHCPRPMIALYEMLRVARHGVVLIEPQDMYAGQTLAALAIYRTAKSILGLLGRESSRHIYEEVGNFAYTVSLREIEKAAVALNYRALAYFGMNDYYEEGLAFEKAEPGNTRFKKVDDKIAIRNKLCRLGVMNYQLMACAIFKKDIPAKAMRALTGFGYKVETLPRNPYL